jgi:D-alanyl-D-alanine carboxypeptidase/D-alanyl-D-alanine-endopeptidase (penicillin-binding protein 4)
MAGSTDQDRFAEAAGVGKSRTKWIFALSIVILLGLGGAVIGLVRPGPVRDWLETAPAAAPKITITPDPAPTPVLVAATDGGTAPNPAKVKAVLDPLVGSSALGTKVHVAVLDVASEQILYSRDADTMTTPASTTKLLTAAAVLAARGPAYRLSTRAVAGAQPGEVVLVGGGDPTLSVDAKGQFPGAARLDLLAARVKKALGGTAPTRVLVDTSLFGGAETAPGWSATDISPGGQVSRIQSLMTNAGRIKPVHNEFGGDPRYADPAIAAGKAFARLLGVPASTVKRGTAPKATPGAAASPSVAAAPGATAAPGQELGRVQSPPLVQISDWMLEQSDNTLAEALGRQVALAGGQPATFDGATRAMIAKLRELGLATDQVRLSDASGLSRRNLISPALLIGLLALAAGGEQPALTGIFGGLPVAGWSGTMAKRFVSPRPNQVGQGIVRAKTGTLSGVNTMAGELITKDGRLLVFAIMASGSGNVITARAALDKVPARLVTCGC